MAHLAGGAWPPSRLRTSRPTRRCGCVFPELALGNAATLILSESWAVLLELGVYRLVFPALGVRRAAATSLAANAASFGLGLVVRSLTGWVSAGHPRYLKQEATPGDSGFWLHCALRALRAPRGPWSSVDSVQQSWTPSTPARFRCAPLLTRPNAAPALLPAQQGARRRRATQVRSAAVLAKASPESRLAGRASP